jgi:NADP-dependent 3-hydroxy acid dehydrogenase YdfG
MVFVITGGGSGLGEMMALALDANGASKVFILGRRQQSLENVASHAVGVVSLHLYIRLPILPSGASQSHPHSL